MKELNIRPVSKVGKVHRMERWAKITKCGLFVNEEDWIVTGNKVSCTKCGKDR